MPNIDTYKRFNIESLIQKEDFSYYFFDRLIIPELLEIQRRADLAGISILFIKGLVERYDTYKSLHLNRHMDDIDLLVSINDVNRICGIIKELGYKPLRADEITDEWVTTNISNLASHHLPVIEKRIVNNTLPLDIEIHTVLTPDWNRSSDRNKFTSEILKHKCVSSKELGLYSMDLYDRLVFSFLNFTNDYLAQLLTFYFCPQNQLFNGKNLLDAYLILKKYDNQIDYDLLLNRIHLYELEYNSLFASMLMNELFKSNETAQLINSLACSIDGSLRRNHRDNILYSSYLASKGICDKDDITYYKEVMSICLSQNKCIAAVKGERAAFQLNGSIINDVYVTWNDSGISFEFNLKIPTVNYWHKDVEKYDGINLRIYNPDYDIERDNAVRNIFVCFKKSPIGEIRADVTFNGSDPTQKGDMAALGVAAAIDIHPGDCQITINIPWELQKVDPSKTNYLGFDCTAHLIEPGTESLLYWSTDDVPYYNPAKFGKLLLLKPE